MGRHVRARSGRPRPCPRRPARRRRGSQARAAAAGRAGPGALWKTWTRQADLAQARQRWVRQRQHLIHDLDRFRGPIAARGPDDLRERRDQLAVTVGKIEQIDEHVTVLEERIGRLAADPAVALQAGDYLTTQRKAWAADRQAQQADQERSIALQEAALATDRGHRLGRGPRRPDPVEPISRPSPDRGDYGIGR